MDRHAAERRIGASQRPSTLDEMTDVHSLPGEGTVIELLFRTEQEG